jgi:signal peptidase I
MDESTAVTVVEAGPIRPRRPWLAGFLSLLGGPVGQVYAGHFRRSIILWCAAALLLPVVIATVSLPIGRWGIVLLMLLVLGIPVYLAVDAFLLARRNRHSPLKRYQQWWVYVLLFFGFMAGNQAVARITKAFIAEAFSVPGRSMVPTIQHADRILVDKLWFDVDRLERNDVVVFRVQDRPEVSTFYVMRVIGLPDDEIEIRNERVLINGAEWQDEHAFFDGPLSPFVDMANHGPVIVDYDCCFVLGDNRRNAKDSRFLGQIPLADIHGKARLVYWSRDYTFPDPRDGSSAVPGRFRWDRIGRRLD